MKGFVSLFNTIHPGQSLSLLAVLFFFFFFPSVSFYFGVFYLGGFLF